MLLFYIFVLYQWQTWFLTLDRKTNTFEMNKEIYKVIRVQAAEALRFARG
jgi:hypothetical protein